jgi:hypothetical protein
VDSIFKDIQEFCPEKSKLLFIKDKITEYDIKGNPKWSSLKSIYTEIERTSGTNHIPYMFASFLNSVLFQERIFFTMSRDGFRKQIYGEDKNFEKWDKQGKFSNGLWKDFKKWLKDKGYVKIHNEGEDGRSTDGKALLFEIVHADILKYLTIDRDMQYQETVDFINNPKPIEVPTSDDGSDDGSDKVLSNKNKDISNKDMQDADSSQDYNLELSMSLLFREEFGIDTKTEWSEMHEMMPMLASYGIENLGIDDCTKRDFLNFLKELNRGKNFETKVNKYTGWSQKRFADHLAEEFEKAVESYVYHAKKDSNELEIVQPQNIQKAAQPVVKLTKEQKQKIKEQAGQQQTVEILKASFAGPTLEVLHEKLGKAKTEEQKQKIINRIKLIERVCS